MVPDFKEEKKLWKKGFKCVAGADEVGRGAFAGPVVAAAVVFDKMINDKWQMTKNMRIDDSKKLTKIQREKADKWIRENALVWGVGEAPASYINTHGIVKATRKAFRRAIRMINDKCLMIDGKKVEYLLVDAFYLPYTKGLKRKNQKAIIKGDSKSVSIAAASIIAKVYRDKLMVGLSKKHKRYSWDKNSGYGTKQHRDAIKKYGVTRYHRKMFVKNSVPKSIDH